MKKMKIDKIIVLVLTMISIKSYSQWEIIEFPEDYNVNSICFLNDSVGFIGGGIYEGMGPNYTNTGFVYKTLNCGESWEKIYSSPMPVNQVFFVNDSVGFTRSWITKLEKTTNSGNKWNSLINLSQSGSYQQFQVLNEDTIIFSGGDHKINFSTDGGQSWTSKSALSETPLFFVNIDTGFVWNRIEVEKTIDRGVNWRKVFDGFTEKLVFIDDSIGFILSKNIILRSNDLGESWIKVYEGNNSLMDISYNNKMIVACGDSGTLLKSYDKGQNWIDEKINNNYNLRAIELVDSQSEKIIVGGENGILIQHKNNVSSMHPLITHNIEIYPNPSKNFIYIRNVSSPEHLISVFNIEGKTIFRNLPYSKPIDISNLNKGVYLLKVLDSKKVMMTKFIKE